MIDFKGNNPNTPRIRKRYKQSLPGRIFIVCLLILLLFLFASGVFKSIVTRFIISVVPVETSLLEDTIAAEFLVIRPEIVIPAPFSGHLEEIIHEGERVAKNSLVGYLMINAGSSLEKTEKVPILSPQAGVLSYRIDGYESILTPQVWPQLDSTKLPDLKKQVDKKTAAAETDNQAIESGEFFFKIVDNLAPCNLYVEAVKNLPERFTKGASVDIRLAELDNLALNGKIADLEQTETGSKILFSIPYVTGLEKIRNTSGSIVAGKYSGMVIDRKMLVRKEEIAGVYLLQKGRVVWLQVDVTAAIGDKAVLRGLSSGDWVITTPVLVKEGQRVFSLH